MSAPAIILVRPQMGENIGSAARAMANFGLAELRLVAPKQGWPNAQAESMATHGQQVLKDAQVFQSVPQALADIQFVYATSARGRELSKPVVTPEAAVRDMKERTARGETVGWMFGPERTGLENEDLALADALITIPTASENPSLNLAQAVLVMAYEWRVVSDEWREEISVPSTQHSALATKEELHGFFEQLEQYLDETHFFRTTEKKDGMWQNMRGMFVRLQPTKQEILTLRGMIRALRHPRPPA